MGFLVHRKPFHKWDGKQKYLFSLSVNAGEAEVDVYDDGGEYTIVFSPIDGD